MATAQELEYIQRMEMIWKKVENPHLDINQEIREQLVSCYCGVSYRVDVNGGIPIPDTQMKDVVCPYCENPASNATMISGHSAGYFNASVICTKVKMPWDGDKDV